MCTLVICEAPTKTTLAKVLAFVIHRLYQLHDGIKIDRRRFETAHMKYAILKTGSRYPHSFPGPIAMFSSLQETLKEFTPLYFKCFEAKYAGKKLSVIDPRL